MLLYCCSAVLSLGRLVNPVMAAMLADSVTERERAVCFPVLQSMVQAGPLVGYFIGYYILHLHLLDYRPYWEVMAGTQLIIVFFIRVLINETLTEASASGAEAAAGWTPKRGYKLVTVDEGGKGSGSGGDAEGSGSAGGHGGGQQATVEAAAAQRRREGLTCAAIAQHYTTGLALFRADRVLAGIAGVQFVSEFALHGFLGVTFSFLVGELHFTQEAAILPGIVKKIAQTVASAFAAWLLPRSGQWSGATLGFVITSAGLYVYGLGSLCCLDKAGAFLGSAMLSFGIGLTTPALLTATSWRVGPEHQAKVQASLTLVGSVGKPQNAPRFCAFSSQLATVLRSARLGPRDRGGRVLPLAGAARGDGARLREGAAHDRLGDRLPRRGFPDGRRRGDGRLARRP